MRAVDGEESLAKRGLRVIGVAPICVRDTRRPTVSMRVAIGDDAGVGGSVCLAAVGQERLVFACGRAALVRLVSRFVDDVAESEAFVPEALKE